MTVVTVEWEDLLAGTKRWERNFSWSTLLCFVNFEPCDYITSLGNFFFNLDLYLKNKRLNLPFLCAEREIQLLKMIFKSLINLQPNEWGCVGSVWEVGKSR